MCVSITLDLANCHAGLMIPFLRDAAGQLGPRRLSTFCIAQGVYFFLGSPSLSLVWVLSCHGRGHIHKSGSGILFLGFDGSIYNGDSCWSIELLLGSLLRMSFDPDLDLNSDSCWES